MKLAYLHVSRTTPREPQEAALRPYGFTDFSDTGPAYIDVQPEKRGAVEARPWRAKVIHACRVGAGDEVWVARPGIWATTEADATQALEALAARGAVLCIASTGRRYQWTPEVLEVAALVREMAAETRNAALAAARATAKQRRADRTGAEDAAAWKAARVLWKDLAVPVTAVVQRTGIPTTTLYRKLGKRGGERSSAAPSARGEGSDGTDDQGAGVHGVLWVRQGARGLLHQEVPVVRDRAAAGVAGVAQLVREHKRGPEACS